MNARVKKAIVSDRVKSATVRLTKKCGQGVLVPGGLIVTAAHCVDWSTTGGMVLGDHNLEPIETADGRKFRTEVYAVEGCADIALLGEVDIPELLDEMVAFTEFAATVPGIPLGNVAIGEEIPVRILTHKGRWIEGTVVQHETPGGVHPLGGMIHLKAKSKIHGGTSGGPVVDFSGRLIGIVSNSPESSFDGVFDSVMPLVPQALPKWALDRIEEHSRDVQPSEELSIQHPIGPDDVLHVPAEKLGPLTHGRTAICGKLENRRKRHS